MNLIILLLILMFNSLCYAETSFVDVTQIGKVRIYAADYNYLNFSNGALISSTASTPEEFAKIIEKAQQWEKQAIEKKVPKFKKEIDSWLVGKVSFEFNYENEKSNVVFCANYGQSLQMPECEIIESKFYSKIIDEMKKVPEKIKELEKSKDVAKDFK